jgi:nucleoside-diphosphate-sugar epimerase
MRILAIGATGFIGSAVVTELVGRGHDVAVVHRHPGRTRLPAGVPEIQADRQQLASSLARLGEWAPDVIVDVILSSGSQAREVMAVADRIGAARVVALSSMDVYRACGVLHRLESGGLEPLPLTESSALRSSSKVYPPAQIAVLRQVFGWLDEDYDKIAVEQAVLGHERVAGTVLRLPMVYGPGDPLHRFYPIVKRIQDGRRTLLLSEEMAAWRGTKGYVTDVARAVALAAGSERAAGQVYNVGETGALTELEWAQRVAAALDWTGEFVLLPDERVPPHLKAPGNSAQHWVADTTRIRRDLGFEDSVDRDVAIRETVAWQRATSPSGLMFHHFDYEAEDLALRSTV